MKAADEKTLMLIGYSVLLGLALGVVWGLLSFLRILIIPLRDRRFGAMAVRDIITFITDIIFALISAVAAVLLFFGANDGNVRVIGLIGSGAGFFLYHLTVGRKLIDYFTRFVATVRRFIAFIFNGTVWRLLRLTGRLAAPVVGWFKRAKAAREEKRKKKKREKRKGKYTV